MSYIRNSFVIILLLLSVACDDIYVSSVPTAPVNFRIDLTGQYNTFRNSSNAFLTFEKPVLDADRVGYGGLLIYSSPMPDENGNTVYYAFDMTCTHELSKTAKVYPVSGSLGQVKCNKCGSVYDISFGVGYPDNSTGPAKEKLRRYKVTTNETYLYVYQ